MTRYPHWQRRHEAVLQWLLSHHTGKLYECARDTGYSPWHLSRIINSQHFQAVYRGEIEKQRRSSSIRRKFRGRSRYCDQQRTAGEWVIIATTGLNMEKNGSMDARTYVATHTLKNGVEITIRAIRSEDKRKLLEAFKQLDRSSIYTRFFGHKKSLSEAELERATNLDFHATVALVATMGHGEDEAIVGGGRYSTGGSGSSRRSAEVAFTVEEDYQGLGIASLLFGHLVRIARAQGLSRLEADVLAVNQSMLKVFRRSGLPMDQRAEGDTVHIVLQLDSAGQ